MEYIIQNIQRIKVHLFKLNSNYTVEKNEIHTIRIDSKGTWKKENRKIIYYFQATETGFPADTLILKIFEKK